MKCVVINKKKIVITNIIIYFFIFIFLTNSEACISSISNSTNIFLTKLLPSLLPYIFLTELVINMGIADNLSLGFSNVICKVFNIPACSAPTIIISWLLGYPNAAKHISRLYKENAIDEKACKKLIGYTNNASPAYIIGTIGTAIFGNIYIGIILLISHLLASILIGISLSFDKIIIQQNNIKSNSFKQISFSFETILTSLFNSTKTLVIIWGFTVFFSLIPSLLIIRLNMPDYINGILIGIFELSNGINILANSNINFTLTICLISFVLSFSSLMVITQIYSFVHMTGVKISYIIKCKLLHGIISSGITYVLIRIFTKNNVISVFVNNDYYNQPVVPSSIYFGIAAITGIILIMLKTKRNDK